MTHKVCQKLVSFSLSDRVSFSSKRIAARSEIFPVEAAHVCRIEIEEFDQLADSPATASAGL
jgi:hypothetical protein